MTEEPGVSHLSTEGHSNGERKLLEVSGTGAMSHPPADHGATALEHGNLEPSSH